MEKPGFYVESRDPAENSLLTEIPSPGNSEEILSIAGRGVCQSFGRRVKISLIETPTSALPPKAVPV
jgi:hypothetical protein